MFRKGVYKLNALLKSKFDFISTKTICKNIFLSYNPSFKKVFMDDKESFM